MLVATEISAASVVIQYWTTSVPVAVWITIILVVIVILNVFAVRLFGMSHREVMLFERSTYTLNQGNRSSGLLQSKSLL